MELHVHLDGMVDGEILLAVAQARNMSLPGVGVPTSVDEVDKLVNSKSAFERFDVVNDIMGGNVGASYMVGVWLAKRQSSLNVSYSEVRYDPRRMSKSSYSNETIEMEDAVHALSRGISDGLKDLKGVEIFTLLVAMRGQR